MRFDQSDIDEAWRGFRVCLWRRGLSPVFVEQHAHELFGQALVEFSNAIATRSVISNPVGWLIHCSWWRTLSLLDKERRRPRAVSIDAVTPPRSAAPAPEEEVLERLSGTTATEAISFLPFLERRLVELIYFDGMSCRAAGRKVGLGKSAADRHHHVALVRLRPFFETSHRSSVKSQSP
jgi:DNA-directed RNA polymerase specialized sigma24 family protein